MRRHTGRSQIGLQGITDGAAERGVVAAHGQLRRKGDVGGQFDAVEVPVADVLRLASSIDVRARGERGVQTDFALRGATFGQMLMLVDGVRLNDAQSGHHNGDIVGKICAETGKSVREVVLERGLLTESELDDIFSVQNLMYPVYKAKRYTDENEQ